MNARVDSHIVTIPHSLSQQPQEDQSIAFGRYIRSTLVAAVVLLASAASFNYLVDPYLRFGNPRIEGFNALKPAAIKQVKMAKAYQACRRQYRTILLGNSRVDVGLNPESDAFPLEWKPVYNLGQPGTGSEAALLYLEHVLAHYKPSHVVLGVDFLSFLEEPTSNRDAARQAAASPERLRLSLSRTSEQRFYHIQQRIRDVLAADLSLSALADSLRTVAAQSNPLSANITDSGFNTAQAFRSLIHTEGQAALFQQKNQEYEDKLLRQLAPDFEDSSEIRAILAIIKVCHTNGIAVRFFIHPYHADVMQIIERTGHQDEFEAWKEHLAAVCDHHDVELWDFSEESSITTETVPEPGDRKTVMDGYWESGHYRAAIGDLLLAQMLGKRKIEDFGSRLSPN